MKLPSISVLVLIVVPTTITLTPINGEPLVASRMRPVTVPTGPASFGAAFGAISFLSASLSVVRSSTQKSPSAQPVSSSGGAATGGASAGGGASGGASAGGASGVVSPSTLQLSGPL
jgi:hypothetical protein